ncbi:unnamed protein product [Mytilus edulis]|uniref:DZIP3-like HEPN domain-containing protein n=1 Tax=Mytilus edulis TaxID=6550 RepID=A0A8S3QIZ8_MYTED|nr:unnamed protein product [Mytilus edulis]
MWTYNHVVHATTLIKKKMKKILKLDKMALEASEENFLRLSLLVLRIAPRAVRQHFDKEFHPKVITKVIRQNRLKLHVLREKRILSSSQLSLLFQDGEVSSDDLDIPTMFVLLRNLADVQITTHLPYSTDFTIESDLARLGFYRKQILHSQHTISNTDFKLFWDTITGAIIRLSDGNLKDECESLLKELSSGADEKPRWGIGYLIIDLSGKVQQTVTIEGSNMPYVSVSQDKLYSARWDTGEIFCYDLQGKQTGNSRINPC